MLRIRYVLFGTKSATVKIRFFLMLNVTFIKNDYNHYVEKYISKKINK